MRIGIIVEGRAEYESFPFVISRCKYTKNTILNPLFCNVDPQASLPLIAEKIASKRFNILKAKGVNRIVVLLDKEEYDRPICKTVSKLETELRKRQKKYGLKAEIYVVLKVNCLENWLLSDFSCIKSYPKRFLDYKNILKDVRNKPSDNLNAEKILKKALGHNSYDKIGDAMRICQKIDIFRAAQNSRSFRRFLRVLEIPPYIEQSKNPVEDVE